MCDLCPEPGPPDKMPRFIIHPFLNVPRRGLGEAVHLGFRVFLAVLGVLHHVGEGHQRIGGAAHRPRVGVGLFVGRAGETDERRIRQGQFKPCEGCEYIRCFLESVSHPATMKAE